MVVSPVVGLPTVFVSLPSVVSAGIGAFAVLASSVNSNARSSGHAMPVSCFENSMPAGTPVNSLAEYSLTNFPSSVVTDASSRPLPLSVTVTVTLAECAS